MYLSFHLTYNQLERKPQPKLNLPRRGHGVDDKAGGRHGDVRDGETEIRMIERVVEFRAKLRADLFLNAEILECRKIEIVNAWTADDGAGRIAIRAAGR